MSGNSDSNMKSKARLPFLRQRLQPSFDLVACEVTLEAMTRKVLDLYATLVPPT